MSEIKKILITGSNGCIGTRLTEILLDKGYDVFGIDVKKNQWNKRVDSVTKIIDMNDKSQMKQLDTDFDLVIHLAAHPYVHPSVVDPNLACDNFLHTFNILEFIRLNNIKRIMFSSSREVYGNIGKDILSEDDAHIKNAESPYSATKLGGEALIQAYSRCYGISHIIFRFSNVYGMYDESDRLIPLSIRRANINDDLVVYGKDKLLDFTYIDDLMQGLVLAIEQFDSVPNQTFNFSGGQPNSIFRVIELIKQEMNSTSKINIENSRVGEVIKYQANLDKAKKLLGFNPDVKIEEGIKKSVEWYKQFAKL
jgi:nucleoside-diphosphate-sugar epimerase